MKNKFFPFLVAILFALLTACSAETDTVSIVSSHESENSMQPADSAQTSSAQVTSAEDSETASGKPDTTLSSSESQFSSSQLSNENTVSSATTATESQNVQSDETPKTVQVTIPEGFTLPQIAARLEANSVCSGEDFINAAQTYDFSYYPLVAKIEDNPNRCYKLEGYLYPDTYEFYIGMKPQDAVGKFLRNAENQIGNKYSFPGLSTDELITLASIIEREADDPENMQKVSSVFHNRLKIGMILQADSTRDYCNIYLVPQFGDKYNQYYNTYREQCTALPAGPISNPGADALYAAAHPADTDYLYFATGTDHKYYYGTTETERDALMADAGVTPLYADEYTTQTFVNTEME
ncbi:MAG: hypothetical protein ACFWUC_00640 [Oscillospiraceae bacterium]|jgi:UPF0755 protein